MNQKEKQGAFIGWHKPELSVLEIVFEFQDAIFRRDGFGRYTAVDRRTATVYHDLAGEEAEVELSEDQAERFDKMFHQKYPGLL